MKSWEKGDVSFDLSGSTTPGDVGVRFKSQVLRFPGFKNAPLHQFHASSSGGMVHVPSNSERPGRSRSLTGQKSGIDRSSYTGGDPVIGTGRAR